MTLNRRRFVFAASALPFWTAAVAAPEPPVVFEGFRFERRTQVAGVPLLLNGTGLRAVAWFKGFAAALYLQSRAGAAQQAVAMAGPKRLQLRLFHDVPAGEFAKAFRKGMERNSEPDERARLAERMARFEAQINALGTVRKNDTVDLDLDPGRGTLFGVNGTLRGEAVPGDDFYATLLRSFVGDKPYDNRLKAGLLGRPA
jgi:Chalcone isomerase-like